MKRVLIAGSGGGSGAKNLALRVRDGDVRMEIAAFVCNLPRSGDSPGIYKRGEEVGIPCEHLQDKSAEGHLELMRRHKADMLLLSGALWKIPISIDRNPGLSPEKVVNIHPGDTARFGGKGFHGHHVHEAVVRAFRNYEVHCSHVTMHYALGEYDSTLKTIFQAPVPIYSNDDEISLGQRVNQAEHVWQPWVTDLLVTDQIWWSGRMDDPIHFPPWYQFRPKE